MARQIARQSFSIRERLRKVDIKLGADPLLYDAIEGSDAVRRLPQNCGRLIQREER